MKINKYDVCKMLGYDSINNLIRNVEVMGMAELVGRTHYWESEDIERYIEKRNPKKNEVK